MRNRGVIATGGVILAVAAAAGAVAAIPAADGTISGCYDTAKGDLRVVDSAANCGRGEQPIAWSQRGPAGETGPTGPRGETGPAGPSPYVATLRLPPFGASVEPSGEFCSDEDRDSEQATSNATRLPAGEYRLLDDGFSTRVTTQDVALSRVRVEVRDAETGDPLTGLERSGQHGGGVADYAFAQLVLAEPRTIVLHATASVSCKGEAVGYGEIDVLRLG